VRWFDPTTASFVSQDVVGATDRLRVKSPDDDQTWLVLIEGLD